MNTKAKHITLSLLLVLLTVSCSKHADLPDNDLPEGKYPISFASSVEEMPFAQAKANDAWAEGDVVAIKVGEEIKQYTAEAGGTLSAEDPFYWKNSEETKIVTAWYCGDGSTAANGSNADQIPTTWTVQADQAINNGYKKSDFLYASEKSISFKDRESTSLPFYHQTARVVINIKNAEAATNATNIASVVIGDANNLALSGTYSVPGAGATAGTWTPTIGNSGMGTITPKDITNGTTYLKSYAALVIPQNMTGKKFIAITLKGDITYYYTPTGSDATLKAGKEYTYNVTVKFGYLDVVKVDTSGSWDKEGEDQIVDSVPITP